MLVAIPHNIQAQTGARLNLRSLDSSTFPAIQGFVDARDANGNFLFGLGESDFTVLEDGEAQALSSLRLTESPVRVAVVINPSEAFSIRDAEGFNRFDHVREALMAWAATLDDDVQLALVAQNGLQIPFSSPEDWMAGFANFAPDFSILTPDLAALSSAQVISAQPALDEGTATAIMLVTAAPSAEAVTLLQENPPNLEAQGTPLFVWLADSNSRFELDEALALQDLAVQSGGAFYGFSGTEALPDLDSYFGDLGNIYSFQYVSDLRENGQHEIAMSLNLDGLAVTSQTSIVEISLETPRPIFLSPPSFIQRTPSEADPEQLAPFSQVIEFIVEYPDGFERPLLRSTLIADGEVVAENHSEPFTLFSWDISQIETNQSPILQIEIEDELNQVGRSVELPVQVSVAGAPEDVSVAVVRNVPQFVMVMALLLGGGVLVFLVLTERIKPPALLGMDPQRAEREARAKDPLRDTPEGISSLEDMAQPFGDTRQRVPRSEAELAEQLASRDLEPAYLLPLSAEGHPMLAEMMVLDQVEHIFGSDAEQSKFLVEDPSVDGQHASIRRNDDGSFDLLDMGKEAGTWINYAPITEMGSALQNGDLVHIGRAAFRFFTEKPKGRAFRERRK